MLIGAHVSVAGGFKNGLDYALEVGAECIQIFAKSPRQWRGPTPNAAAGAAFSAACRDAGFGPVFTHTAYLINLSTTDEELRAKSVIALADELVRASLIDAAGVVTHVGNDPGGDRASAAVRAAGSVRAAFELAGEAGAETRLLLENTAGAGRSFGCDFGELAQTIDATGMPHERLGICLDTCHAFAHGFDLTDEAGWDATLGEIERVLGMERLGLVHANDCMFERGSHRDRHAWIGEGHIGDEGFRAMLCDPRLGGVPLVTEMPGDVPVKDTTNLGKLKALRESCGPSH